MSTGLTAKGASGQCLTVHARGGRKAGGVVTEDVRCTLRIDGDTCNASAKRGSAVGVVISTILNSQNSV